MDLGRNVKLSQTHTYNNIVLNCASLNQYFILIFVYKQQNALLPVIFENYYEAVNNVYNTRQQGNLTTNLFRTHHGQSTIRFIGAQLWNQIPENIKKSTSLTMFKNLCKAHIINKQ